MADSTFISIECAPQLEPHLLADEVVEILLALDAGIGTQVHLMAITSKRLLAFRGMGYWDQVTSFPYQCFIAAELHDSVRPRESQVHLRLSGLMDPARMLPYLQVTDRGPFERVWAFHDRATARRVYSALVGHIV